MYTLATTRITIYRGTVIDEGGDEAPTDTPLKTGVLASIVEKATTVFSSGSTVQDPTTPTPRVVRQLIGRVGSTVDIRTKDRIEDERTGERYVVMNVTRMHQYGRRPDIGLELKRVEAI